MRSSPPTARAVGVIETTTESLPHALGLESSGAIVSIVGGGGKSALLFALGRTLPGATILTTTTRIFASQLTLADQACTASQLKPDHTVATGSPLLVVGEIEGEKASGVPLALPAGLLTRPGIEFVVIEADGSRMRPAKAPADHEPVVPAETTLHIVVAGIDALAEPLSRCCHRPERVSEITGVGVDQRLGPADLARLLTDERGGQKRVPDHARRIVFLNKVERPAEQRIARAVCAVVLRDERIERVVTGALDPGGRMRTMGRHEAPPNPLRVWRRARE